MNDYAYPTMMAENALKRLHEAMLSGKFEDAKAEATRCIVECRLAYQSIVLMEQERAGQASTRT